MVWAQRPGRGLVLALTLGLASVGWAQQWSKTYGLFGLEEASSIRQTSDGGFIVAGLMTSLPGHSADLWVFKLDVAGVVSWQRAYGGPRWDQAHSVEQTSDGGYVVAGETGSFGAGGSDAWVLKLDATGNVSWERTYGGAGTDRAWSIHETRDGGLVVAGLTDSFGAGGWDAWVLRLSASGGTIWQRTYGGLYPDWVSSIRQTVDGGVCPGWRNVLLRRRRQRWLGSQARRLR